MRKIEAGGKFVERLPERKKPRLNLRVHDFGHVAVVREVHVGSGRGKKLNPALARKFRERKDKVSLVPDRKILLVLLRLQKLALGVGKKPRIG